MFFRDAQSYIESSWGIHLGLHTDRSADTTGGAVMYVM